MSLFTTLDHLKADLDALRPLVPEQEQRVLQKFRLEWNYNSNAIEGNSLTLGETRSLLLHGLTAAGKPMRDHLDIKGHNEAVVALEEFVRSEYPLTEQFIREMHQLLLGEPYVVRAQTADGQPTSKRIVPGRYKTSPNNVLTATNEMFYFASVEETPGRMTDLVNWYRAEDATPTLHPVALAAEFHYRFVRIHPFDDGNGRMSRLLMNLILLRHGYPMTVIQNTDRNRYLAALAEADADNPEPFLRFIIDNVEDGLRLMIRAAKGESIDEPDDLDKKLALLKKQVLMRDNSIQRVWDISTQHDFYNNLFKYWRQDFSEQMQRFEDLFLRFDIGIGGKTTEGDRGIHGLNSELAFGSNELLEYMYIHAGFNEFRLLVNSFVLVVSLTFSFTRHKFDVSFVVGIVPLTEHKAIDEIVFSSLYKDEYDLAQIHALNHQLATKVYDFIAAKVAEADSAPS